MLHHGSRQYGLQADATDPHVPPREDPGADGQETMRRKAIQGQLENNPALDKLLPHIQGNVGLCSFTKQDLTEIRDMLLANKVPGATCAGVIAPCGVTVPAQNTGSTEILSDVQLIKTGDKVGASEATLLNVLSMSPFSFGLVIQQVSDKGSIYNPEGLDITEEALPPGFLEGVRNVAMSVCKLVTQLLHRHPILSSVGTNESWFVCGD
ncbi:60S acidic ribosomal protein P0 [Saguinus oedipus]|uniref:Large ribosomal subunit protein uL10 n=1 Tax=Saguinus oedipus TaxID=9490 RepID=A0ABQ9UBD0_SAGOE|nr:60S acidic ribosomal protein P0 [Saguinus oedipus]